MTSKSEQIRQLAAQGLAVAEIARCVGVRYQHAYSVLKSADRLPVLARDSIQQPPKVEKPPLLLDYLLSRGFEAASHWEISDSGGIQLGRPVVKRAGVYAFAIDDVVQYVGVATMGLAKRLYLYGKPGSKQTTNIRLNGMVASCLSGGKSVLIATACPDDLEWNSLPVNGATGLEFGLIMKFDLPWNKRSSN